MLDFGGIRMREIVRASNAARQQRFGYKRVFGAGSVLPSSYIFENGQKGAERAVLSVRRGPIRYRRNSTIVCEGGTADYVFMVVDGVVRRCKAFQNGTRAIVAFHTPGELFGWTDELTHALSIEAATDALILYFKRNVLMSAASRDHKVANTLLRAATSELRCIQLHSLRINQSAKCRVAGFLLDLSARMAETANVDLLMSHQDVADHLGLSIETVSRTITELERACLIERASARTISLINRAALARLLD
jgi:CRP/FNR family nitrogen fixation transcriptional regulator